ncbi:MBL fold metallo-hydrolase [Nocardia sp. NEAU-G5]|uniref:MBL fold metallo-hydrolase n=1 Tax=Nocardia albiluteola TaxID=2842303 RepID=A0ABS6BBW2_9NOCA|nr:MBL fold metallo-hydrolase [Nocardia albiluteola]MBU3067777.1 MBL fold metallo-hydrolase [Nocardia albiluteola]
MEITHYGHACVYAEISDAHGSQRRVLFDPGTYSRGFEQLRDLDLIMITHSHPDHLDVGRLSQLLADNPTAELVLGTHSAGVLAEAGHKDAAGSASHVVASGDERSVRGIDIRVVGGEHACIHSALPPSDNLGFILGGGLLHPGDAFDNPAQPIDVLLLPIGGPWMKIGEGIDYLRAVAPRVAIPIHQAGLAEIHQNMHCGLLKNLAPNGTEIVVLEHGVPQYFSITTGDDISA